MSNGKPDVNLLEQWIEHPSATHVHHEPVSGKITAKLAKKIDDKTSK